ncbi:MAG: putative TrmH family tRNA/rRNA methyltransferase [Firmicutes bacterium ADurb.Bin193]|nr:MAG: putative TrmH family tRNA/rRNA methyltransferase [Firmicutes bacterium ADurb.Bin193]
MKYITSPANKLFKDTKKLLTHSGRVSQGLFIAEGARIANEAVLSGSAEYFIINESFGEMQSDIPVYVLSDRLFESISDTKTTQGIAAVCRIQKRNKKEIKGGMLVACDGVSDPGNLGTIIRTAECAGAAGVVLMGNCADPYSPKTVRSTMGSIFRMPLYYMSAIELSSLPDYTVVAAMTDGATDLYEAEFKANTAMIIGSEAHGVSREAASVAHLRVKIPMRGGAESLNAAVAAGVIMYEIARRAGRGVL